MSIVSKLRGAFTHAKDAGASIAIEHLLARQLEPYGELKLLKLNSRDRSIHLEVLLKGESQPLSVEVLEYELVTTADQDFLIIRRVVASREWVTALLHNFLVNHRHPIPHQHSKLVRVVLNA